MMTDQEYFSEYFTLCEFFLQKRGILEKVWEKVRKSTCDGEYWGHLKELSELNKFIREEEALFQKAILTAKEQGVRFQFEEFSDSNGLGTFEKKTALFLLYVHLLHPVCGWQVGELVALLDCDTAWDSKIRFHAALSQESPLFRKNILNIKPKMNGLVPEADVAINPAMRKALLEFIPGQPVDIPALKKPEADVDTIGLREPEYSMDAVILPQKVKEDVLFLIDSWKNGMSDLGIEEKIKKGRGTIFLFYGPPGTGKSMLADGIAQYLGKKVLQVNMPQITDKLFGETEKNIANLFKSAKAKDAVICFDEADSLLYSRQRMEHERDIAFVNVMLQEIERFDGVLCLTTNFDTLLDPALERRVSLKVRFSPPDESLRGNIWRSLIPSKVTLAPDVAFDDLAKRFVMSGGYIKNAVMNALRRLAQEKRTIMTMEDLLEGGRMEQEGMFLKENKGPIGFAARA